MLRACVGVAVSALLSGGCELGSITAGETRRETQSIDLGTLDTARVVIRMTAGELRVQSGTPKMLEANFAYNVPDWKPLVDYRANGQVGDLTISQPDRSGGFGNTVNTWELKLSDQVPLDVTASLGAGEADLRLGQMDLRSVEVNMGAGELKMDLRGEPKRDYHVRVQGGVGEATLYLPRDVAISARATGGIGEISATGLEKRDGIWVNPERINGPVTVHVDVKGGIGEIRLIR